MYGMSLFTSVITRLMRNFPRLIPDKPGCRISMVQDQNMKGYLAINMKTKSTIFEEHKENIYSQ